MILSVRVLPLDHPADRSRRLLQFVLAGLALLLLSLWNPLATPGPVVCLSRRAFSVPCPFCGVTRGVSLCLRGRPVEASTWNPLTVPIFVLGVALMVVWAIEYLGNFRFVLDLRRPWRVLLYVLIACLLAANWIYVIHYCREDDFASSWLGQLLRLFW
jgi:hypothetical protein